LIVRNDAEIANVWTRLRFPHGRDSMRARGGLGAKPARWRRLLVRATRQAMIDVAQALAGRCTIWVAGFLRQ